MSNYSSAIVFATLVALSGASWASPPPFDELDANNDGVLSRAEAAKAGNLDFAAADTNQDGVLDRSEYEAATG